MVFDSQFSNLRVDRCQSYTDGVNVFKIFFTSDGFRYTLNGIRVNYTEMDLSKYKLKSDFILNNIFDFKE